MKKILIVLLISCLLLISACNPVDQNIEPTRTKELGTEETSNDEIEEIIFEKDDYSNRPWNLDFTCIPDAKTAVKVAEAYLKVVFGENTVNEQQPLHAGFDETLGIWGVFGTVDTAGGNIAIYLDMKDGRVLLITMEE